MSGPVPPGIELAICGGTVVLPSGPRRCDIGIADGRVAALADDLARDAPRVLDAGGLHVFPGAVDAHVHLNEPGRTDWEGFATGTAALAAGGTTTAFDMPLNSVPPTTTPAGFHAKRRAAEAAARIDFGLWGGIVPGNLDDLDELAACGAIGFKAFMSASGVGEFAACDERALHAGMERAAGLGMLVAVHAEDEVTVASRTRRAIAVGATTARDYLETRPVAAELRAIETALALAADTGCALHVVHVSCGAGVALVAEARAAGVDVSCETCPHYLVLTDEDLGRLGAVAKCAPPLRPRAERDALWAAIADGSLPMVVSDHSPAPPELKDESDLVGSWGGIAGAQTLLTLLLSEGHAVRALPLELVAELVAGFAARRFAIEGKGLIQVGADADLALVALSWRHRLRDEDLHTRHRVSPYLGRPLRGRIVRTLLRGQTAFDGSGFPGPPRGRLLSR